MNDLTKKLVRPTEGRMLAGVCAGLARYLNIDVTIVRILAVILAFGSGTGVVAYLIGYALMPEEGTGRTPLDDLSAQFQQGTGRPNPTVPPQHNDMRPNGDINPDGGMHNGGDLR